MPATNPVAENQPMELEYIYQNFIGNKERYSNLVDRLVQAGHRLIDDSLPSPSEGSIQKLKESDPGLIPRLRAGNSSFDAQNDRLLAIIEKIEKII